MIFENVHVRCKENNIVSAPRIDIRPGELVFINGPSGSGKTLLLKTMAGVIDFYEPGLRGEGTVIDDDTRSLADYCESDRDVFYTGQDIENYLTGVYAEDELAGFFFDGDYEKSVEKSIEFLDLHKPEFTRKRLNEMSRGQLQELLFFVAYLSGKKYIFLDEPFSTLDRFERRKLSAFIQKHTEKGHSFIISGHGIECFYLPFDRAYRIKDSVLEESSVTDIKNQYFSFLELSRNRDDSPDSDPIIKLENIDFGYDRTNYVIKDFSAEFRGGEIVSLYGMNGSGKTTLARIIAGELKPRSGRITGKTRDCVFIGRAPEYHFLYDTLEEEMENCGPVKENFDRLDFLHLRSFQYLSYGQKMRFITSLYSTYDRNVFIFDESLSGQDSENIKVLYDIFLSLKKRGKCVILIGQDKLFFTKISTRTIYMKGNND